MQLNEVFKEFNVLLFVILTFFLAVLSAVFVVICTGMGTPPNIFANLISDWMEFTKALGDFSPFSFAFLFGLLLSFIISFLLAFFKAKKKQ